MLRPIAAILFALLLAAVVLAKPERPPGPKAPDGPLKVKPIPKLAINTNWGVITQSGRDFSINGHPDWNGVGHIYDDDRVILTWTFLSDGRLGPGFYKVEGVELVGQWGWAIDVKVDDNGKLSGGVQSDRVYKLAPPEPDQ